MSRISTVKTVAGTLSVALSVGFLMQIDTGDAATADAVVADRNAVRTLMMSTNAQGEAVFGVPDVVTAPLNHADNVQILGAVAEVYTEFEVPQMGPILATPVEGCAVNLSAEPQEAAMVQLSLSMPCAANEDFILRQGAFQITVRTDSDGAATLSVPALTEEASFVVLFDNVEHARVTADVPDAPLFDRAILQWSSVFNFQLHALEAGASIGDPDHVWSASAHSVTDAAAGDGGFVMRFGTTEADIPYLAEVYTYPAGTGLGHSTVLQIGVTVTAENCGQELDSFIIQTNDGQPKIAQQMITMLPGCDEIGQVVMLRDKFEDLKLAAR